MYLLISILLYEGIHCIHASEWLTFERIVNYVPGTPSFILDLWQQPVPIIPPHEQLDL